MSVLLNLALCAILRHQIPSWFKEPEWTKSTLTQSHNEFRKVHQEITDAYGPVPEYAFIAKTKAYAALDAYKKSKRSVDFYRAIYLWLATGRSGDGIAVIAFDRFPIDTTQDWAKLPVDDYEIARLRFLFNNRPTQDRIAPFGLRLLVKDPNDVEVLCKEAGLLCDFKPDQDIANAEDFATRALKLKPCAATYLRYAAVKRFEAAKFKRPKDGEQARLYFEKYLRVVSDKAVHGRADAKEALQWLHDHGY